MKTGTCKFGPGCRFHHPWMASAPIGPPLAMKHVNPVVKLTLAGLPRREVGTATTTVHLAFGIVDTCFWRGAGRDQLLLLH